MLTILLAMVLGYTIAAWVAGWHEP
jgi:hypothetical protein